jgi:hypothetical protein
MLYEILNDMLSKRHCRQQALSKRNYFFHIAKINISDESVYFVRFLFFCLRIYINKI